MQQKAEGALPQCACLVEREQLRRGAADLLVSRREQEQDSLQAVDTLCYLDAKQSFFNFVILDLFLFFCCFYS